MNISLNIISNCYSRYYSNNQADQLCSSSSSNSYLLEIDENSEVDQLIRAEIDIKFRKSEVNTQYRFPRVGRRILPLIKGVYRTGAYYSQLRSTKAEEKLGYYKKYERRYRPRAENKDREYSTRKYLKSRCPAFQLK